MRIHSYNSSMPNTQNYSSLQYNAHCVKRNPTRINSKRSREKRWWKRWVWAWV